MIDPAACGWVLSVAVLRVGERRGVVSSAQLSSEADGEAERGGQIIHAQAPSWPDTRSWEDWMCMLVAHAVKGRSRIWL